MLNSVRMVIAALAAVLAWGNPICAQEKAETETVTLAPGQLPQDDVLDYLEEVVQWHRDVASLETALVNPREKIFQENLEQGALNVLRRAFQFARLQSSLTQADEAAGSDDASTVGQRLRQRAADMDNRIKTLRGQLGARGLTKAQRQSLEGKLKLAEAKQELYRNVLANIHAAGSGKGLTAQIDKLAKGIPELSTEPPKAPIAKTDPSQTRRATSMVTLIVDLFDIARRQRELDDVYAQTTQLQEHSRALVTPLRETMDRITGDDTPQPVARPAPQESVDTQLTVLKRVSTMLLPLGDATFGVMGSKAILEDWRQTLDQRLQTLLQRLAVQLTILIVTLLIPLALGEVARRAIKRYVTDNRRKRLLHNIRRVLVGVMILFILLFNFISDFSSFATFAGFLTAGLAVALQSVLLSLVAHFFFYGRYGVRPGDRVNVAGVTGDIVQIGVIRFYIREYKEAKTGGLQQTGKIVAFPNSILFQPSAFYKYVDELP